MAKYILKRVLRSLITMVIVITVVFSLLRLMPIEGYFENFDKLSETQIQVRLNDLGLNDPLPVQLGNFFNQLLHGDLGESIKYRKNVAITTIIAGITGSASGGLTIALELFGETFVSWGYTPEIIHRVASIACGGLDTLPWNGTVVMMFTLSGVGYSKGYKYVAVITVILPIVTSLFAALLYTVRMGLLG